MKEVRPLSIYPSETECISILREVGCKKRIIVHCCTVRVVAMEMIKKIDCNKPLVIAGALLHDIGRARDHSIMHAFIGARMAEDLGISPDIVEIIRKHTGAGLDQQDIDELGLPQGNYIPETIEQKIVAHADNMVSDDEIVEHSFSVDKLRMKGSERGAQRIDALHKELSKMYGEDLDALVETLGPNIAVSGPCGSVMRK